MKDQDSHALERKIKKEMELEFEGNSVPKRNNHKLPTMPSEEANGEHTTPLGHRMWWCRGHCGWVRLATGRLPLPSFGTLQGDKSRANGARERGIAFSQTAHVSGLKEQVSCSFAGS